MIGTIWNTLIKQPILTTLLWLAGFTGNIGVAIIVLTIIIQLILIPLRLPSLKSARKMRDIKPKIDALKDVHGEDKMALAQAQMALYQEHGISPLGGLLPTLLSIPIIIALYQVLLHSITTIENSSTQFLWMNITHPDPYYVLPVLVGLMQFVMSSQMMTPNTPAKPKDTGDKKEVKPGDTEQMMQMMQTQMRFIFPIMSAVITASLPAGVGLYWLTSVVFAIIQNQAVEILHKNGSKDNTNSTK